MSETITTEDTVKEFKLDTELHTNPNYNQLLNTEGKLASLKVGKPDNETWFMVHPEHQLELYILEATQKGNLTKQPYLVQGEDKATHQELLSSLTKTKWCCCHLVATSTNSFMIWPRKLHIATDNKEPQAYHTSAAEAVEAAKQGFIKMEWKGNQYTWRWPRDENIFNKPVWPEEQTFVELIQIAFRSQVIQNMDHPQVMYADGRAVQ